MREEAVRILQAEEELADYRHEVPDARVDEVVLAATGSEEKAEAALRRRINERLRRNEKL